MRNTLIRLWLPLACAAIAGPASAGAFDNVFFVRKGATAQQLFSDRAACADIAKAVQIGRGEAYSDPDYGVLSAMGAAIDSDSMHGGISKIVQRAALEKCMEKRGWVQQAPIGDDVKPVRKASSRTPGALDAWMRAHEPAAPPTEAAASRPAAPVASATPAPASPASPAQTPSAGAASPPAPAPGAGSTSPSANPGSAPSAPTTSAPTTAAPTTAAPATPGPQG